MALDYPSDVWREVLLAVTTPGDLLSLIQSYPSFAELLADRSFVRQWLNGASPRVQYEFGDVGGAYNYGDWIVNFVWPRYPRASLRFLIECILAKGCNAPRLKEGKQIRCGRKAGFSTRDDATFSFDLLKDHGWKICKQCLSSRVIMLDDYASLAYLSTFTKVFPSDHSRKLNFAARQFRHLDFTYSYYTVSEVDQYIEQRSSGLFRSFSAWRAGVIAKRGSTSELQIRALQHGARGFLELPGGPGRTRIALEIAEQSIKEYRHSMMKFVISNHPDLTRLNLVSNMQRVSI